MEPKTASVFVPDVIPTLFTHAGYEIAQTLGVPDFSAQMFPMFAPTAWRRRSTKPLGTHSCAHGAGRSGNRSTPRMAYRGRWI